LAKKESVDIFEIHNSWVPMFLGELSFLPEEVMTPGDFAQTFYPVFGKDLTLGNGIVGIPLVYDGLELYINEEIFSTYGKTPPKTWDDFSRTAQELTLRDDKGVIRQAGAAMGETTNVNHWQEILGLLFVQNGANLANPTGELANGALRFYTSFSTKYKIWNETMPESLQAFANGQLAMYLGLGMEAKEITALNPNIKFRAIAVPQLPKEVSDEKDVTYASTWVEAVSNQSEEGLEAWKFLKFISQKEILSKLKTNISYSRVDVQSVESLLAPVATSWYLAGDTNDGATGINSQIGKYYSDAVNAVTRQGVSEDKALEPAAAGVAQVLASYGISAK
jgi:multiple sugar transport system substrate-binding protein